MNERIFKITKLTIRLLIGLLFVVSAVMKLLSLQNFEVYVYSFNLFGFAFSTFVARAVIAAELLLGMLLMVKILYKPVWWLTQLMLLGFTGLLVYTVLFRHDANCHCMGDIVQLKPAWSIVKNVVGMLLLLLVRNEKTARFRGCIPVGVSIVLASLVAPYALYPMDALYNKIDRDDIKWNDEKLQSFLMDSTAQSLHLDSGRQVIGFVSAQCSFCKTSVQKIKNIFNNNNLDVSQLHLFIFGSRTDVQNFQVETETERLPYLVVDPYTAINITQGAVPSFFFLEDGEVVESLSLRTLDDKVILSFFE